jgi:acetyl esterase/lipase
MAATNPEAVQFGLTLRDAQVAPHLRAHHTLQHSFLELIKHALDSPGRRRPGHEPVKQLGGNVRLSRLVRRGDRHLLEWHSCSLSTCYALHTKFLTGSAMAVLRHTPLV